MCNDVFDDFVCALRVQASETGLKKVVADWESKIARNRKRVERLEGKLFEQYTSLAVVRLDLGHASATFSLSELDQLPRLDRAARVRDLDYYDRGESFFSPSLPVGRVGLEEVQRDREHLFASMKGRPTLFGHLVGYIWRIDFTPHAGYHLRLALFFDGAHVEDHVALAEQIGEYWVRKITKGCGRFFNCNRLWSNELLHYAPGLIHSFEQAKRVALSDRVLSDFYTDRLHVQVIAYPGCNLFGSGFFKGTRRPGQVQRDNKSDYRLGKPLQLPTQPLSEKRIF